MFQEFLELPRSCVFSIEDSESNRVYINYTESVAGSLARLWEELQKEVKAGATLRLRVLDKTDDTESLRLFTEYWRGQYYRNKGWKPLMGISRSSLKYDVGKMISADFKNIWVYLKNARGNRKVTGVFKTHKEADEFIERYYSVQVNPFRFPVYAFNDLTKSFLLDMETKDRRFRI